jgi:hypothetical protein
MKKQPSDNDGEGLQSTLHTDNWEVRIAEMKLRGGSVLEAWYPLLASILSHVGQTSVLAARSAKLEGDAEAIIKNINVAKFASAVRASLVLMNEGGAEYSAKKLERITAGDEPDPAKKMVEKWIAEVGKIPADHFPLMDTKLLIAMRIKEDEDTIQLVFDETLCGKNLHHPDDEDAQTAMREEMEKQEKRMGITNKVPPVLTDAEKDQDGIDEDGTTTTTKDIGGFVEVRKTKDRERKPKKPAKGDKPSLNDFLDEMLSRKQAEADKRAKDAKDKRDAEDDEPLPPSRFN